MSADELTGTEIAVLMVLMAEARSVRNPDLATLGPELKKPQRDRLQNRGLIDIGKDGRSMTLELTDKGWKFCSDLMGTEAPKGAAGPSKALFTVMAGLGRWFHRDDIRPAEVFFPRDTPSVISVAPDRAPIVIGPATDVAQHVRDAYASLASEPGAYVRLSRLRPALDGIPRADLDAAIYELQREPGVHLIPEENQKTLTDEDRDAAVVVGNQHNHLLAIHS
ncbi:hypothetical protein GCM10007304_09260 [Rhodococcoides trifolii]|uniref:Uncharacterized protein n=1 Tax=Rhodococcoides trifolii TaxID=908250 RepID=A0A917CSZ0_9NOCA|nr:hypothetical protein [Rhodococcus trifolii]GGF97421.1 hypothetical protein GCM10007304_09260 [Rhodococcus trifolii]